jgi:hypothetical protein
LPHGYPIIVGAKGRLEPGKNCQKWQADTDFTIKKNNKPKFCEGIKFLI